MPSRTPLLGPLSPQSIRRRLLIFAGALCLMLVVAIAQRTALFVVPPAVTPRGVTLFTWRGQAQPWLDSTDALCLRVHARPGAGMALCRQMAKEVVPPRLVIARLPYWDWLYLRSTGGQRL